MKKPRKTKEEKLLELAEKEAKKLEKLALREIKKQEKEAEKLATKAEKERSETDIVRQYAKIIMDKQKTRDMLRSEFKDMRLEKKPNKTLWMDNNFYFSVVFQSVDQKFEFLNFLVDTFNIEYEQYSTVNIINGLKLAEKMGCKLKKEIANPFPLGNMELRNFILDEEN